MTFKKGMGLYVPADVPALLRQPEIWREEDNSTAQVARELRERALLHAQYFSPRGGMLPPPASSDRPPWVEPPAGAEPFEAVAVIATPAVGSSGVVLSFRVPYGFDGVIRRLSHNYTGGGFVQGSGDLIWRLTRDGAAVRNFESLAVEFGSIQDPRKIDPIRIFSGQLISYVVEHAPTSGLPVAGTRIVCSLGGYFYPTGEERR